MFNCLYMMNKNSLKQYDETRKRDNVIVQTPPWEIYPTLNPNLYFDKLPTPNYTMVLNKTFNPQTM